MRAVTAMLAFLFAYLVIDAHLGHEITFRPAPTVTRDR